MASFSDPLKQLYFLNGGGEMGELIRAKDWSQTALGDPKDWNQSLKIAVAIMLDNPFGMYIAWGADYIQLYNDGYRPILGSTKHPKALGISTRETFEEIWHIIESMFDGVMNGKAVGFPDFMLPLNRNGFVEECYFDFSYSPIRKDDGTVGGVLVTVIETTNKKRAEDSLKKSEIQFRGIIDGLPLVVWTADTNGLLTYISKQWEDFYGNSVSNSLGNGWITYVHLDDVEKASTLWLASLKTGINYETEFRVQHKDGQYRWLLVRAIPERDSNGKIVCWNGSNTDIHDKKVSEEVARKSDEKFRAMADNIPNLAWMANADGYIYWYNKKWFDYTGTTPEQMEGWGWQSVHQPDLLPVVLERWQESIATGKPFEMVFPLKAADGAFRQFLTRVLPVHDDAGKLQQWFGTNTDITDRIEAEQSLKESEERFRTMAEGSDILIATSDHTSNATYFNQAWINFTGRSMDELLNYGWADLIHREDRQGFIDLYTKAFESRHSWSGEFRMLNKDGEYRWLHATGPVRYLDDGTFAGYISASVDFTERKKAEQAAAEREKNLRNTILQAPVAMCILKSPEFVVELANDRMFELWGKTSEQVMHKPLLEGLPEVRGQGFDALLEGVYKTGITFNAEEVPATLPRNGKLETVYVNFVYAAYHEDDGAISGVLAVAIDTTPQVIARRKIEEVVTERTTELANANKKLQKSNDELSQFAYITSHDLQEPLRKISTFSNMLEKNLGDKMDDKSRTYLHKINNSSERMNALIRDVLTYSELVKDNEAFVPVDLNKIVQNIQTDYDLRIEEKGATIHCTNLPTIEAIPLQMSQLFGNIVGNALKFVRSDVKPVINISSIKLLPAEIEDNALLKKDVDYVKIVFADNGIGFKMEYSDQIFNIFQRLHRRTDYEGTGIGLSMCKKIALNHHGDLNAKGSSENGAIFNVILPVRKVKE